MVPVVSAHFRSLRRQFPVWRLVHSTRSELDSAVNSRVGMHVLRSNRAPNDLVSLQPIKSRRWRAWPTHASCNWADLLQVSSVHDIVCCEPTLAPHSQEVFAGSRGGGQTLPPAESISPAIHRPRLSCKFQEKYVCSRSSVFRWYMYTHDAASYWVMACADVSLCWVFRVLYTCIKIQTETPVSIPSPKYLVFFSLCPLELTDCVCEMTWYNVDLL